MPLTLRYGSAGSGKTRACLEEVARELRRPAAANPLILVVPEQASHQTERACLARLGASWRVQVLSFRRLAWRVFQEAGGASRPPITDLGRKLVLRAILQRRAGELGYFGRLADRPGVLDQLSGSLRECRAYEVSAENLLAVADTLGGSRGILGQKLADLATIMGDLARHLEGRYTDPDQSLSLMADRLAAARVCRRAQVWVDGFSGFTPQEYRVLGALLRVADRVTVTLTLDPGRAGAAEGLFTPTLETRERLVQLALDAGAAVEEKGTRAGSVSVSES
ncbi:MAG: helicase-exonuclease AddAB subunit AddB, partial [Candidatus Sericytochromatia bacterium]|nr:helicase-exonuclease AddAB subunit AddB [Candidatus Tanganyikabacteria bacterium]